MRILYLLTHFLGGSIILWQSYRLSAPLWVSSSFGGQGIAEGLYLAVTIVWGNVGWDHYKLLKDDATLRALNDTLYKTTLLPVAVLVLVVGLASLIPGLSVGWRHSAPLIVGILLYAVSCVLVFVTYKGVRETQHALSDPGSRT